MQERPIPPEAMDDPDSMEMIRVWIAKGGLHCSMKAGFYEDRGIPEANAWGIILADIARHVERALSLGWNKRHPAVDIIIESMMTELREPTSKITGDVY